MRITFKYARNAKKVGENAKVCTSMHFAEIRAFSYTV